MHRQQSGHIRGQAFRRPRRVKAEGFP
jgi:hypothetical protein